MHPVRTHDRCGRIATRAACLLGILALATGLVAGVPTFAAAAPGDPVLHEQTDARFGFSGPWATYAASALSGTTHATTNAAGASVTIAFVGTRLNLIGTTGPKSGYASVSIDGATATNVDLYSADTLFQQVVYTTGDLPLALHVVRISCTGTKNPASIDTYVSVDGAWVSGTLTGVPVEQSDYRIVKRGGWATYSAAGLSGGSHAITNVTGNEYAVAFNGTRFDLVGMVGPKFGIASVSVDGGVPVDVDFYNADTLTRQLVFSTGDLPDGAHVVRVLCSGRRDPASSDAYIGLDAALVTGTITQAFMRYEETDGRIAGAGQLSEGYSGDLSGGRYIFAGPAWGAVSVSFVGTQLNWVPVTGPNYGIASISVDGGAPGQVDLYTPGVQVQRVIYSTGELPYGQHTVTFGWTGTKNPASSGTYVSYDAFDVAGDLVQAAPPTQPAFVTFNYPWSRYIVIDKSDLRLYYVVDGALVANYPVAVGKPSTPTPSATWRIDAKYYSSGVYGPRKMRLFRQQGNSFVFTAYNLHGTDTDSSIGTYASHGCIRMHNYDVIPFFDTVPLGTMVVTRD